MMTVSTSIKWRGAGWSREWESHPPEEVYEASLCALVEFPAESAKEIKRAGNVRAPAREFLTRNKHLLAIYSIPTRGFTADVSVFWGTPPAKPFDCK